MFRKTVWKKTVSDAVSWHQDQALNTTIFILKEYGPTGFLLKEEGETKHFKVCLGDPHTCSCSTFHKERDLCKHICWVLLRKFRLPREHEYCFQQGLVERQIVELLQGLYKSRTPRHVDPPCSSAEPTSPEPAEGDGTVRRKVIEVEDVCPICQEEMLAKRLPVSYCRFGCGNNVHISCMKVWADHQARPEQEAMVKCPLCREDFGPVKLLREQVRNAAKLFTAAERERPDRHLGVTCNNCRLRPITGKCFKCTVCRYYHLCEDCMRRNCHPPHQFAFRLKRTQAWLSLGQLVFPTLGDPCDMTTISTAIESDSLPEHVVRSLPGVRVRNGCPLLDPGKQCRICLKSFQQGQKARHLPCRHKFHTECIDPFLRQSNSCPLDGYVIYNPLTTCAGEKGTPKLAQAKEQHKLELFVPGVALLDRAAGLRPSPKAIRSKVSARALVPLPQDTTAIGLQGLCINTVNSEHMSRASQEDRPLRAVVPNETLSSELQGKDESIVKLGSIKSSASPSIASQNHGTGTYGLSEVSGGTDQRGLFVGLNRSNRDQTVARVQWMPKARKPRAGTGVRQHSPGLTMTGVVIKRQGERE
ncbi:hypothetical protein UPYG_G00021300 [Umbra pygmaea]|uniref:E3 ubiquitin-protein ligase ZSWIM2 n=1 Tax=Umbra pygmaea TaxID=75934 RepID=A0ABD0Y9W6_UMBPY